MRGTSWRWLPLGALLLAAPPAFAQLVSPQNDRLLWCASAFYWLAASAEDSGEEEEAELYDRWSKRLLDIAGVSLTQSGVNAEKIEELVAAYDAAALEQLGTAESPHDIIACPELLGDWR
jgi:hypothetical protein